MEGFLEKQSSENPQLWKGRWFVMKDDKLFYYKREADVRDKLPTDATVCGVIPLADIDSVTTAVRRMTNYSRVFGGIGLTLMACATCRRTLVSRRSRSVRRAAGSSSAPSRRTA